MQDPNAGELVHLFESVSHAAVKATDAPSPADEERAIDGLLAMKKMDITTEILVQTQIGKRLRKLTKHKSEKIRSMALEVLDVWKKKVVVESSSPKAKATPKKEGEKQKDGSKANRESPKGSQQKVEETKSAGGGKEKTPVPRKLKEIPRTGDTTRDRLRQLIVQALCLVDSEVEGEEADSVAQADVVATSVGVEAEMWKSFGGTKDLKEYKSKYRTISFNLKDPNNPDLRRRVLLGEVTASRLVCMTPEEMASDTRKQENLSIKEKMLNEAMRTQTTTASTDQFKCGKCHQRKCTYFQMQTRSADEPMTTFVTCLNCNNRWKFC